MTQGVQANTRAPQLARLNLRPKSEQTSEFQALPPSQPFGLNNKNVWNHKNYMPWLKWTYNLDIPKRNSGQKIQVYMLFIPFLMPGQP